MTDIQGRTAFVTGGASGIGLALARSLGNRGARVMLADIQADRLAQAEAGLGAQGIEVASVLCDVARADSVRAAADATLNRFGAVHIVVNNAGVAVAGEPGAIALEDWRWIVDINLMGVVHGVEIFTPLIKAHGQGGHILNTASLAGLMAGPNMGPYNATKFAVVGYSETLRADLEPHNIGVSVLCPAWVQTDIHRSTLRQPSGTVSADDPGFTMMNEIIATGLPADHVAEWSADCIEANRLYILTHPDFEPFLEGRHGAIHADFDAYRAAHGKNES